MRLLRPDPKVAMQRRIVDRLNRAPGLPQAGFPIRPQPRVECHGLRYVGYYDQANAGAGAIAIAHITKADDSDGRPR